MSTSGDALARAVGKLGHFEALVPSKWLIISRLGGRMDAARTGISDAMTELP